MLFRSVYSDIVGNSNRKVNMKASEFCYWLQGFFEVAGAGGSDLELTSGQISVIERHLALVFKHDLDPQHGDEQHQAELQAIHDGKIGGVTSDGKVMRC